MALPSSLLCGLSGSYKNFKTLFSPSPNSIPYSPAKHGLVNSDGNISRTDYRVNKGCAISSGLWLSFVPQAKGSQAKTVPKNDNID
jgi:hypothetical protein